MLKTLFLLTSLLASDAALSHNIECLRLSTKGDAVSTKSTALSDIAFKASLALEAVVVPTTSSDTSEFQYAYRVLLESGEELQKGTFDATTTQAERQIPTTAVSMLLTLPKGVHELTFELETPKICEFSAAETQAAATVRSIPAGLSLLPPILTLVVAVVSGQVLISLYAGVFAGSILLHDYNPITAFVRSADTTIPGAIADTDHAIVLLFTWMLAGIAALLNKSGGSQGLAELVVRKCRTSFGGQLATMGMGLMVFFDDYANVLIVGNSVRPVTDLLRVSREKLAFIVDCTAAPIASIVPVSSWIGFELSLIKKEFDAINADSTVPNIDKSPFITFIDTIPYRFYPIFLIAFVFATIILRRDFGPMLKAERQARKIDLHDKNEEGEENQEQLEVSPAFIPKPDTPIRAINAIIPIVFMVLFLFAGLLLDGYAAVQSSDDPDFSFRSLFVKSNSFNVFMWTGIVTSFVCILLYWVQGILKPTETLSVWIDGMKEIMEPVFILTLAWSLGTVVKDLDLGGYLIATIKDSIGAEFLPTITFLLSGIIAFATGSSWSTLSVMFPIVVKLAWVVSNYDYDGVVQTTAAVLAGAVLGDHCSPISDTTILSAMSCKCSVKAHVKTQLPYAALVGVASILVGVLPVATDTVYSPAIAIPVGCLVLVGILYLVGKPVEDYLYTDDFVYDPEAGRNSILARESSLYEEHATPKLDKMKYEVTL